MLKHSREDGRGRVGKEGGSDFTVYDLDTYRLLKGSEVSL